MPPDDAGGQGSSISMPNGPTVANSNWVLFACFLAAFAVKLRDLGCSLGVILILACLAAGLFEMRSVKACVKKVLYVSISVFFREIESIGAEKIPRDDPVMLVCAPHSNQFLDPVAVLYQLPNDFYTRGRKLGFIVAAASLRRRLVGFYARLMDGIPVERAQDLAQTGTGLVSLAADSLTVICGYDTNFKEETKAGDSITFKVGPADSQHTVVAAVTHIESDEELCIKALPEDIVDLCRAAVFPYKFLPRVSQTQMFRYCHDALGRGDCIGIFPEGGSHDQPTLLPIKAGVSIMALGAMAHYPGRKVKIVPVGITYFQGHRFRSRAFIEYGEPMEVDQKLVDGYREGLPQKGTGSIECATGATVRGVGTAFGSELEPGDVICIQARDREKRSTVISIDAETLKLSTPLWGDSDIAEERNPIATFTITKTGGKKQQHAACDELLEQIRLALMAVTINAQDAETLKAVWTAKALYKPSNQMLSPTQSVELTRRMLQGYKVASENPAMKLQLDHVKGRVQEYETMLKTFGLRDWQVGTRATELNELLHRLAINILYIGCYTVFLFVPGMMAAPVYFLARFVAEKKARDAVSKSSVKVKGTDVMATFKVMTWMVCGPLSVVIYAIIAAQLFDANFGLLTLMILPPLWQMCLHATDTWRKLYRSLKPLWLAIWRDDDVAQLAAARRDTQRTVRALIKELGTQLNFEPMQGLEWSEGEKREIRASTRLDFESPRSPGSYASSNHSLANLAAFRASKKGR